MTPEGAFLETKVLNRQQNGKTPDAPAPITAIRQLAGIENHEPLPACEVRLGTTRGTNALLTRSGARTAFVTTKGFRDLLLIGDQARPNLFDLNIQKRQPLYETAIEIEERILFDGQVETVPDLGVVKRQLQMLRDAGIESIAISLMHGFQFSQHEKRVAKVAREIGFVDVRASHEVAPLIKIVPRSETTVLDAYLNPVIASYIDSIEQQLTPGSTLQLMTSNGGLVPRSQFSGKDSVLSGPAGGVVAAANVGRCCGVDKVIGFDMGGTSTDVSRFDGQSSAGYERDYETVKAGVRIMTPMLAIETVAAGGGSICRFDGAKLVVGPESAGADPGPACYGRGGPLTVTDLNFLLGRICVEQFPFPLHAAAAENRIDELRTQLQQNGFDRTREELAAGLLQIANQNMASAIESISVGKGYDPKDYALVSFGGAAAQHACAVATLLNMSKVIDHPRSSILSADGIRAAVPVSHSVRSVLRILVRASTTEAPTIATSTATTDVIGESELIALIDDAIAEAETKLGVDASTATRQSTVILNLRYVGTEPYLSIACGTDARFQIENVKRDFEAAHLREFGFVKKDASIELVAARAEASVICKPDAEATRAEETFAPTTDRHQKIYSGGKWSTASLFNRSALEPGAKVHGPAIIASRLSTTVIDPGWVAETLSDGTILIEPDAAKPAEKVAAANRSDVANGFGQPDPVTLEIFNQHFSAIASRMGISLQKTSVSVNVKERLDFSCALFTGSGDLVVNAPHIPVHLGAMSETVRQVISRNGKIKPGSVFVTNNPYAGGSHLPDVTVVSPVFVNNADAGPTFWVASRSHHSEIGGKTPGSMPPDANCLGEEGVLIDNFSLIAEDGSSRFEALRQILLAPPYPSRSPDENLADVAAQVAANRTGEQQLLGLVAEHGRDVVVANMHFIQQAAETKARTAIAKLPDGVTRFEDSLDNGAMIRVQITKANDRLEINFSGTDPVQRNNFNANRAIVSSAVMYVVRLLIDDEIPLNEGVMKPVEIVLPECFLNPEPAEDLSSSPPVVGGNVETSQRIVDVLIGSLNVAAASQGTMNNWLMGDDSFGYYETLGGGSGATSQAAGADAVHVHMTNTRLTDPEVLESRYPVVLRESSVRNGSGGGNDSGGAGKHRGGNGMVREIEFKSTLSISLLTNRRNCEPWGIEGGENGSSGINLLIAQDGSEPRRLPGVFQFQSQPGDRLRIETPGGGGWGKPRQG